jgi:hypothetical protein
MNQSSPRFREVNPSSNTGKMLLSEEVIVGPSNRHFGILGAVVFAVVSLLPLLRGGSLRLWALVVGLLFCGLALIWPRALAPLNRAWLRTGLAMHCVLSPVVMVLLFYGVVTPFGLMARLLGKTVLRRARPDRSAQTYWISRVGEPASRMNRQF